jgi:hypothetical protein
MREWAELGRILGAMAASDCTEVREDGEWLAGFSASRCDLRCHGNHAIVHLWSDGRTLTRRVLDVKEQSENRIILEVQRFGRSKPGLLEFARKEVSRRMARVTREEFRVRLRRILGESFPDARIESLSASPDLEHSFSGIYVRGQMHEAGNTWALLAIPPGESSAATEASLAFGILWLDWCRSRSSSSRNPIEGLRLFAPEGASLRLRERALALSATARTEVFEFLESEERMRRTDPADVGNLESWLVPRSEMESILAAARKSAARFRSLLPQKPELSQAISQRVLPGGVGAVFSFWGLEFARWSAEGLSFGLGNSSRPLSTGAEPALERLIARLELHRSPVTSETSHSLYRKAAESWLETLVLEDPARLDAQLDPRYLYSQVPAVAAGDRGVLDLLGITRRGRLVVIELKASEDIQLPLQAVDYWIRVRRHQRQGDFQQFGYFNEIEIDPRPPLLWLVAPLLHFHSTTEVLLKYLSPEIQVSRVGLNENWRRGIGVVSRQ